MSTYRASPLRLQVLETDYLDATKTGPLGNGNYCVGGIELDAQGRRLAYWLHEQHPGEMYSLRGALKSSRIAASEILHVFEKERPGQVYGVSRLAAALIKLRDLDEYSEALIVKKKIEACLGVIVTTDEDNRVMSGQVGSVTNPDDTTTRLETLAPGMIQYVKPGETIEVVNPSSNGDEGFSREALRAIAVAAGVTYEQLTGDLSGVNYSSIRAGLVEFRRLVEQFRWGTFIPMACTPIAEWFKEAGQIAGTLGPRQVAVMPVWTPPRWEWVDPLKDVQATVMEIDNGLRSRSSAIRERGDDPEETRQELADEQKEWKAAGVQLGGAADITPSQIYAASEAADAQANANTGRALMS